MIKVPTFFDIEYLRNDTRWSHGYYKNVNRKSYARYGMVIYPMTLTDPQPGFQGHCIFVVEYLNNGAF